MNHVSAQTLNKRSVTRLFRQPKHTWQLRIEDDLLVTKNITDMSSSGLSFKAPLSSSFEPGQLLRINLSLSPDEDFECHAKIMWVRPPTGTSGVMKLFGVSFVDLPAKYDALITRTIFEEQLDEQRRLARAPHAIPKSVIAARPLTLRSVLKKILGYALISVMATAFIMAAWVHKNGHPEESIANIFNKALATKLQAKLQPRSVQSE